MPRNGSGAYSRAVSAYVFNTIISQTDVNAEMDDIATALTASIAKDGQTTPTANLPMGGFKLTGLAAGSAAGNSLRYEQLFTTSAVQLLGAMDWVKGANIASATTINLTTATGNAVHVTGTTQIDAVTLGSGMWRMVIFDGILTLAHSATNNNLPGGANITTAANDRALYWSDGTTVYCVVFQPAAGYQIYDADTLKSDVTKTLTVGYSTTPYNAGTKSSGTYTPDEANGAFQYCVNGGAFTLAPPTNNCTLIIQITNNGSAGTITTSGFTKVSGATPGATNGDDFLAYITKINGFSHLSWQALQ